jgi:hypothetical protein
MEDRDGQCGVGSGVDMSAAHRRPRRHLGFTVALVLGMAVFFALGSFVPAVSRIETRMADGDLHIDCDRTRGDCSVRSVGSVATWSSHYVGIPIAHIQRAQVVDVPGRPGAVQLVLKTPAERQLTGAAIDPREQAPMRAAADKINAFLADPAAGHVFVTCPYGSAPTRAGLFVAALLVVILGFIVATVRIKDRRPSA